MPFVDPGTTIAVESQGDVVDVVWMQRRKERFAKFLVKGAEGVVVEYAGRELSYRSFFALEDMGDVLGIAQTTTSMYPDAIYIDTEATSDVDGVSGPALDLIMSVVSQRDIASGLTPFVMLTAEAGAGKTSLLKELVRTQAAKFVSGQASFVFLYVNAQGRALARFHEALATELNELRVSVPYHSIAVLVRQGLIVPVVDGFDELLGAGGYDEAFASIWSFIQELDGKGAMVTSARSTYYEQEFLLRAEKATADDRGGWELHGVSLADWGDGEREKYVNAYVERFGGDAKWILQETGKVFAGDRHGLAGKPLFVARTVRLVAHGAKLSSEGSLISRLADEFIDREIREKLITKDGVPILTREQMRSLCSDFAEEMWSLGTRELDRLTVAELAELAMSDSTVADSDKAVVVSRMPNMAFLEPGESVGAVSFEHELFFDHFLASRAAQNLINKSPGFPLMLSRAPMPPSLTEGVTRIVLGEGADIANLMTSINSAAESRVPSRELVKENCGRLAASIISEANRFGLFPRDFELRNVIFPGVGFAGAHIVNSKWESVEFKRADLRGVRFENAAASNCVLDSPLVDERTRLDIIGLDVNGDVRGIRLNDQSGTRTVFEPGEVGEILRNAMLPSAQNLSRVKLRPVDSAVIDVLESYVRASSRSNPLCVRDDASGFDPDKNIWAELTKIGAAANVFRIEYRQVRGPKTAFVRRLFRSEQIMAGRVLGSDVEAEIKEFWLRLEKQFPAK